MKAFWYNLNGRERLWVIIGSLLIGFTVAWFYGIKPLLNHKLNLQADLRTYQTDQAQLAQLTPVLLQPQVLGGSTNSSEKMTYLIAPLLQRYELDKPTILLSQTENANGTVSLRLQQAAFDQVMGFIGALELHHQVYAVQLSSIATPTTGLVSITMTLSR